MQHETYVRKLRTAYNKLDVAKKQEFVRAFYATHGEALTPEEAAAITFKDICDFFEDTRYVWQVNEMCATFSTLLHVAKYTFDEDAEVYVLA